MTLPALDGIPEKLQALLTYDASSPLIFSSTRLYFGSSIALPPYVILGSILPYFFPCA